MKNIQTIDEQKSNARILVDVIILYKWREERSLTGSGYAN